MSPMKLHSASSMLLCYRGISQLRVLRPKILNQSLNFANRSIKTCHGLIRRSKEVSDALQLNSPVVALETTIYTHGFPYPENVALALHLEQIVRQNGGIPATIGILNGVVHVGFEKSELRELLENPGAQKVSRRDIGYLLGMGLCGRTLNGGTTIAGTMILAHLAGIKVFATGGLGGVHRNGENSLDISADLTELGRTPVAVVSSGCKSFLDLARTLEYLETEGVAVSTFADGRVGDVEFPAFWSRESGLKSPRTIQNEEEAARIIYAQDALGISSGLLFANPVPSEASIPISNIQGYINEAIDLADRAGAVGSDNTPFILRTIKDLSQGKSVIANRALIESNVRRGTKVAVELAKLQTGSDQNQPRVMKSSQATRTWSINSAIPVQPKDVAPIDVLVAGSLALDSSYDYKPQGDALKFEVPKPYTSNPAKVRQKLGGVGHNVARAVHLLGSRVQLCSFVADDIAGGTVINLLANEGLHATSIKVLPTNENRATAQYAAFNDVDKNLHIAMADMSILEGTEPHLHQYCEAQLDELKPNWLIVDANWNQEMLQTWMKTAKSKGASVAFEPVSQEKATRIFQQRADWALPTYPNHIIDLATPNAAELLSLHSKAREAGFFERQDWWEIIDSFCIPVSGLSSRLAQITSPLLVDQGVPQQSIQLLPFIPCILTKLGKEGVLLTKVLSAQELTSAAVAPYIIAHARPGGIVGGVYMRLYPSPEQVFQPISVNGAGDTFMGSLIAGLAESKDRPIQDLVDTAQRASVMTLKSEEAVHPNIGILASSLKGNV